MASKAPPRGSETQIEVEEWGELEVLESEVREMSEQILRYRATLPEKLKNAFVSSIEAQRPVLPESLEPGTSRDPNSNAGQVAANMDPEGGQETLEKIQFLREKISSNSSELPIVLKRMRECISKVDKLDCQKLTIHPAFKRKRSS